MLASTASTAPNITTATATTTTTATTMPPSFPSAPPSSPCVQMQTGVKSLAVPIGTHRWWWATEEGELVPTQITVSLLKEEADIEAYEAKVEDEKSWALEGYALTS